MIEFLILIALIVLIFVIGTQTDKIVDAIDELTSTIENGLDQISNDLRSK